MDWYNEHIEEPIREIVKNLRNNGINTFCSCGHGLWIQCECYDASQEMVVIFNVLNELGYKRFRITINAELYLDNFSKFIEITLPDQKGNYYCQNSDNLDFIQQKF